ncbi:MULTISPECIES: hypothetical protein [Wolbachia]|uniref:Uncharacterized protein n=1 Tax=Wolbachia pipientis TaxID=955 RepID=A0A6C1U8M7_WOLPI|nr:MULTISPECIES: hypothetical protein [Wolbachia]UYC23663.1 hypothetical protein L3551_07375 [Wolbachia endosymbiont of Aedes aegypti]QBB83773.1 hypothetical protein DEJ70_02960 [Wolbachia pipientis wAlbB]QDW08576.1 hypothetical protein CO539_002950 [Wolbachia pipientis]QDW09769.1 hypothetical protein CO538_002955 [Wolbachia pipientis]QZA83965.1 hypothetical protein K1Y75_02880 [Wolbachia pipientis]
MVAVLSVTEGKNKVIVSGLVGVSSTLVFLTVIHIAAKIAIIVTAAAVTYALLSLLNKARPKSVKTDDMSEDEGYSSVDEGEEKDTEISEKEPERTETELEEEIIRKRAQERMEKGSLGGPIDAENSNPVDYTKTMVVPEKIILGMPDDKTLTQNSSSSIKNQMKSLPEHMDVSGNPLPEQLPSNLPNIGPKSKSTQKLSAADLLLRYGNVNNDVRKVLEWPITSKEFNGLGFNR